MRDDESELALKFDERTRKLKRETLSLLAFTIGKCSAHETEDSSDLETEEFVMKKAELDNISL
jgi:hypothetical protein